MSSGIFRTLGRCHTSDDLHLISAYRVSSDKLPAFSAEARDQMQASSVGNFSGQVALELVSYVGLLLIFLVIFISHCSIFIHFYIICAI